MSKAYRIIEGSAAARFHASKAKIKLYGGGFANGKTTALVAEALKLARDYPGSTGMLGRATHANLMKTLVREFYKWCPPAWIKSSNKNDGVCYLENGTTIDFRYVVQQSSGEGESTSNLLSANYDWIVIDQIEDPEITHHDFMQLMGRLRGTAEYVGDDPTMPRSGPRWMILSANPSMGWLYKKLVKPIHDFRAGRENAELMCLRDADGEIVYDEAGNKIPMVEVFEASTYDNAQNLASDYLAGLESTYTGKMRDRYILGKWVAFEGVVYDDFDDNVHVIPHTFMMQHIASLRMQQYALNTAEGYDFGIAEPSCYLHSTVDAEGTVYLDAGFYEKEKGVQWQADEIKAIREEYSSPLVSDEKVTFINADPAIFRRTNAGGATVGDSTATMFQKEGIMMQRGNNAILNGILKVKSYLYLEASRINPFTHAYGCPKIFISDRLQWLIDEMQVYRWKKNRDDDSTDSPVDKKNHALDALRYLLSTAPARATMIRRRNVIHPSARKWTEYDTPSQPRNKHRYAS